MARRPLPNDLPDEVRAAIEPHLEPDTERLDAIAQVIRGLRDEAKRARESSGIELLWAACEEAYIGIDDANRAEFGEGRWAKPMSMDGPLSKEGPIKGAQPKSSVYVRLTSRYVDAGAAKVGEILLPPDDKAFSISETPVPELIKLRDVPSQIVHEQLGPGWRPARPGETPAVPAGTQPAPSAQPAGVVPGGGAVPSPGAIYSKDGPPPGMVPLTTKDIADEQIEFARKKAKKAEKRIYDWMIECQYASEMRKVIFDASRIGVGVLKGPFPKIARQVMAAKAQGGGIKVTMRETVKPACRWVDPWNIYPDPACGENIHDGDYIFERDFLSPAQVRKLLKDPSYIAGALKVVLQGQPKAAKSSDNTRKPGDKTAEERKGQYEAWYFYGTLSRDDMACICQAAGRPLTPKDVPYSTREVFAIVTMIDDQVVKAAFNPLDSGHFPYNSVPWQRRAGHWAGIGVAEQVWTPQRMVNASTRAMLDNAGISAGGQIVINRDKVVPADNQWVITPNKVWYLGEDSEMPVEDAFGMFQIPAVTDQLMAIIQYALRIAEESTNIPLVTQGQSGPTQPDTLGGMQLQNNNANQLLRSIGYAFDDFITEPVVRAYYEWLLLDPDIPDDEKGDFTINARGSAALVERAIQDQILVQILPAALNPAYKLDPAKTMDEFLKSKRFDPRNFRRDEEEQARIDAQPPPAPPQVEVAKINAESREKIAQAADATKRDQIETVARVDVADIKTRERLALLEYANRHNITIEQAKTKLADTSMKLTAQLRMAGMREPERGRGGAVKPVRPQRGNRRPRPAPQVATPPMEPAGRAPNGEAFQA